MMSVGWTILTIATAAAALLWPQWGALAQFRRRRAKRLRTLYEDALKHILAWEHRGQTATPESLAGALELPARRVLRVLTDMERRGLLDSSAGGLRLSAEGEQLGLHVVRAHRLWERYLADDAGLPMGRLHQAAEIAEHELSAERLDELDAHLGHPQRDPHGDPIPGADGSLASLNAVPLTDWPDDEPARIVHLEDEPTAIFQQILAADLKPGMTLRVLENTPERLLVSDGENEHRLAHVVASNIQVAAAERGPIRAADAVRLSDLDLDIEAEVIELDSECRGFSRRRLMDLGLTPGARVSVALENTFGDPRGFRVRGAMIALRKPQADHVWVQPAKVAEEVRA